MASQNKENCTSFIQQCSLLYDLKKMSSWAKKVQKKYKKSRVRDPLTLIDGDPAVFMNQFVHKNKADELLKITPLQKSFLTPTIRFWKVYYDKQNRKRELEFQFKKTKLSVDDPGSSSAAVLMSQDKVQKVGVKSVQVDYVGKTPAYADKKILIEVDLFAKEIGDLFEPPGCVKCAPLSEFISPPAPRTGISQFVDEGTCKALDTAHLAESDMYEVKMVYGWAVPEASNHLFSADMRKAIESTNVTMMMTLYWQQLDFTQEGNVTVKCKFAGRLSKMFDSERADIFGLDSKIKQYINNVDMAVKAGYMSPKDVKDTTIDNPSSNQVKQINRIREKIISASIKREQLVSMMRYITDGKDQLYFKKITLADVHSYIKSVCPDEGTTAAATEEQERGNSGGLTPVRDSDGIRGDMNSYAREGDRALERLDERTGYGAAGALEDQSISNSPEPITSFVRDIPVIFFADLVDAALQNIQELVPYKGLNYRVILGPVSYFDPQTGKKWNINLGDIPITVHEVSHWYNNNFVKQDRQNMTFYEFLMSVVNDLLMPIFKSKCHRQLRKVFGSTNFNIGLTQMSVAANKSGKDPLEGKDRINILDFNGSTYSPHIFVDPKKNKTKASYDYFIIYASNVSADHFDGSEKTNRKNRIINLSLGTDRGIVKKMNFSQVNIPKLKNHFMLTKGSPFERLKIPYNCSLVLFGNNFFLPGSMVYLNPSVRGLGDPRNPNSMSSRLGLGGYYLITRAKHKLTFAGGNADFETVCDNAMWQNWPQGCRSPMSTSPDFTVPELPAIDGAPPAHQAVGESRAARSPEDSPAQTTKASDTNREVAESARRRWGYDTEKPAQSPNWRRREELPRRSAETSDSPLVLTPVVSDLPNTTTNYHGLEPPAVMHVPSNYFNNDHRASREFHQPGDMQDYTAYKLPSRIPDTCTGVGHELGEGLLKWLDDNYPPFGPGTHQISFYDYISRRNYTLEKPFYIRSETPSELSQPTLQVEPGSAVNQFQIARTTVMMKEIKDSPHHVFYCCRNNLYGWFIYNYMLY